jgi:hypothetical protein
MSDFTSVYSDEFNDNFTTHSYKGFIFHIESDRPYKWSNLSFDLSSIESLPFPIFFNTASSEITFYLPATYTQSEDGTHFQVKIRVSKTIDEKDVQNTCLYRYVESLPICCPDQAPKEFVLPAEKDICINISELAQSLTTVNNSYLTSQKLEAAKHNFREAYKKHCLSQIEDFTCDYNSMEYQTTLYYYDNAGNLVRTVPPAGVSVITDVEKLNNVKDDRDNNTQTLFTAHDKTSTYKFNNLNKQIAENIPDQEPLNLIDYPTKRKKHNFPTPYIGGLVIGIGCLIILNFFNSILK